MQRPSYPKETADQWPPIAGGHSGWGGACNQSINTGRSLGEQYNLLRRTPTLLPPLSDFLLLLLLQAFTLLQKAFLTLFISTKHPITTKQSCASPLLYFLSSFFNHPLPPHPHPPTNPLQMTSLKFQRDRTNKREECCRAGAGEGGEDAVEAVRETDGFERLFTRIKWS